jgi:hypothetical protein
MLSTWQFCLRFVLLCMVILGMATVRGQSTVMLYAPLQGTKTHYQTFVQFSSHFGTITLTASDGSKVDAKLLESLQNNFLDYRSESLDDFVETVVSVGADGARVVKTEGAAQSKGFRVSNDLPLFMNAAIGYAAETIYAADGTVNVNSFFYDTSGLPLTQAAALRQNQPLGKQAFSNTLPNLYNRDLSMPFVLTNFFYLRINSGSLVAQSNLQITATSIGVDEQQRQQFDLAAPSSSAQNSATAPNGQKAFLKLDSEPATGAMRFLPDGRLETREIGLISSAVYTFVIPDGKRSLSLRVTSIVDASVFTTIITDDPKPSNP